MKILIIKDKSQMSINFTQTKTNPILE